MKGTQTAEKQQAAGKSGDKPPGRPPSKRPNKPPPPPTTLIGKLIYRFRDGQLLLGDLVVVAATEASSERIPLESMPMLTGVSLGCWLVAAIALGDYRGLAPYTDNWYLSLLGPTFMAVVDACMTWAVSVTACLAILSVLVSNNLLDSSPLLEDLATENLSPQLEVAVATLITMACWRGIAARLRYQ